MGCLAIWKILEEMIIEFRQKEILVPSKVIKKLRSAKTLINVLERDPDREETSQKIEKHLLDVQSYLISEGEKKFGKKYVENRLQRLEEAGKKTPEGKEEKSKLVFRGPRDKKWIRIQTSDELPIEEMKSLAGKLGLSYNTQEDSSLLVCGRDERVKRFLKKLTAKYKPKKDNNSKKCSSWSKH